MTIINTNSISGINSITAQGASGIEFYESSGVNQRLRITSAGNIGIGQDNPQSKLQIENAGEQLRLTYPSIASYIHEVKSNGDYAIDRDGTERLRIDSNGRLLKGWGSTAFSGTGQSSDIAVAGTGSQDGIQVVRYHNSFGAYGLTIGRSRGTTIGTHTQVTSGSDIGYISFVGSDGTNWRGCADIAAAADGNITSSSAEGKLIFKTTRSGSTTTTQAMTIKANHNVEIHDGNLVFETSGNGIDFSATGNGNGTMTSELLDDYEEGTWTPTIEGNSGASGQTYSGTTRGSYTKVGRLVVVSFYCEASVIGTLSGSSLVISGLPYTVENEVGAGAGNIAYFSGLANNVSAVMANARNNTDDFYINHVVAAGAATAVNSTNITNNGVRFDGVFSYRATS